MSKEFRCAGCRAWYNESESAGECPYCENENVSEVRDVNGGTERAKERTQGDSL